MRPIVLLSAALCGLVFATAAKAQAGYADALDFCHLRWEIAVDARAYRGMSWTEDQTTEQLTQKYAYPNGVVYRSSPEVEALVRAMVAAAYLPGPEDFASQESYMRCVADAQRGR